MEGGGREGGGRGGREGEGGGRGSFIIGAHKLDIHVYYLHKIRVSLSAD